MSSMPGSDQNSVVAVFSQHSAAENAIRELKGGGFDIKKLAVVGRDYQSGIAGRDGAVLPILHLNGYKINNPTLLARISHEEPETVSGQWLDTILCTAMTIRSVVAQAFVSGFRLVMLVCASLAIASAAVAWRMIPTRTAQRAPDFGPICGRKLIQ